MAENKKTYHQKLLDPRWQKKRLEILSRDEFICQDCGDAENTLHVHHKIYSKGCEPWEYENSLLITLCENCHEQESQLVKEASEILIQSFKKSPFLSAQWIEISNGIEKSKIFYGSDVTSVALSWMLQSEEAMEKLKEMYFKYLSEKSNSKQLFENV